MRIDRTRAMWPQIAEEILRRIHSGEYPPGSKVPSVVQIANEFGVVNSTAQRAMEHVRAQGVTRSEKGMGTFVLRPEEREAREGGGG
ncbi:GntR family transcriptional regulator [Streptomyces carminius]|uniref:GntR family transcriptional regulator n=1 Tax=Streptomyces carminius TaxID=2665496 RepID=A0A2M8LUJ8_9ACTN|nr:winged helix-turn-helix domain-containing protein [Streptomyces carminius]PJE95599.1 GntR family transcriptional regulator [Streptomyces carminius]